MSTEDLPRTRREYEDSPLTLESIKSDPFKQFAKWYEEAKQSDLIEPNAMALATSTKEGRPSQRMVLLKGFREEGFVFYTNYDSRKGGELSENPYAALLFFWPILHRQIRIEGEVNRVSSAESDEYFLQRPQGAKIGAHASDQSKVIADRLFLEEKFKKLSESYKAQEIPRPENWGGFILRPETFEFWQGGKDRLHDRIRFKIEGESWKTERLAP